MKNEVKTVSQLKAELKSELEAELKKVQSGLQELLKDKQPAGGLPKPWPWTKSWGGKRAKCGKCGHHILVKYQPGHEQVCKGE